jgi:hypothetical protein
MLHYEEDFYAALNLGFGKGFGLGRPSRPSRVRTAPYDDQGNEREGVEGGRDRAYGFIAFEGDAGRLISGRRRAPISNWAGPSLPIASGKTTLTVPIKVAVSLNNCYELNGEDTAFGFFDVGGRSRFQLTGVPGRFRDVERPRRWRLPGFGDTEAFNFDNGVTSAHAGTWIFGIGLSY